jgi:exopolyphosphatase/guanosine-5'-triphosphate,3'-diphosphate pyrophosphatase
MRLGVLDVGSNTVHLLVVDSHRGGHPDPMRSEKTQLRLAEHLEAGRLKKQARTSTGLSSRCPSA